MYSYTYKNMKLSAGREIIPVSPKYLLGLFNIHIRFIGKLNSQSQKIISMIPLFQAAGQGLIVSLIQVGLKPMILLPQPFECGDYKHEPPHKLQ